MALKDLFRQAKETATSFALGVGEGSARFVEGTIKGAQQVTNTFDALLPRAFESRKKTKASNVATMFQVRPQDVQRNLAPVRATITKPNLVTDIAEMAGQVVPDLISLVALKKADVIPTVTLMGGKRIQAALEAGKKWAKAMKVVDAGVASGVDFSALSAIKNDSVAQGFVQGFTFGASNKVLGDVGLKLFADRNWLRKGNAITGQFGIGYLQALATGQDQREALKSGILNAGMEFFQKLPAKEQVIAKRKMDQVLTSVDEQYVPPKAVAPDSVPLEDTVDSSPVPVERALTTVDDTTTVQPKKVAPSVDEILNRKVEVEDTTDTPVYDDRPSKFGGKITRPGIDRLTGVTRPKKPVTLDEAVALRSQLRREQIVSRQAYIAGAEDVSTAKNTLISYIKENVPSLDQGKFLTKVKRISSTKKLDEVFKEVDDKVLEITTKRFQQDLDLDAKKLSKESDSVYPVQRRELRKLYEQYEAASGDQMAQVKIVDQMAEVREQGRIYKEANDYRKATQRAYDESRLEGQDDPQFYRAKRETGLVEDQASITERLRDTLSYKYEAWLPQQLAIRKLDGGQVGGVMDDLFNGVRRGTNDAQNEFHSITESTGIAKLIQSMDERSRTIVTARLILDSGDPNQVRHLKATLKEADVREVESATFTADQQRLYDTMKGILWDDAFAIGNRIQSSAAVTYGKSVDLVDGYVPMFVRSDVDNGRRLTIEEMDNIDTVSDVFLGNSKHRSITPDKGGTQGRVRSDTAVYLDPAIIIPLYLQRSLNFIHMVEPSRRMVSLLNSDTGRKKLGRDGVNLAKGYLEVANNDSSVLFDQGQKLFDRGSSKIARVILGSKTFGNISTAVKQYSSLLTSQGYLGTYLERGMAMYASKNGNAFLKQHFADFRQRSMTGPDVEFGRQQRTLYERFGNFAMRKADSQVYGATLLGAYRKNLAERGIPLDYSNPDPQAITYAQKIAERTQGATFDIGKPLMFTKDERAMFNSKKFTNLFFTLKKFQHNAFSQLIEGMMDVKSGQVLSGLSKFSGYLGTAVAGEALGMAMKPVTDKFFDLFLKEKRGKQYPYYPEDKKALVEWLRGFALRNLTPPLTGEVAEGIMQSVKYRKPASTQVVPIDEALKWMNLAVQWGGAKNNRTKDNIINDFLVNTASYGIPYQIVDQFRDRYWPKRTSRQRSR